MHHFLQREYHRNSHRRVRKDTAMAKYKAEWESLKQYRVPKWFEDAKLGIFIHWGVISVPGQGCWYPQGMYGHWRKDWFVHHLNTYGHQKEFGYKDFIPKFKAEKWDPDAWLDLFVKTGARYVVPVADFHDAFAMYDSDLTEFSAVKMGPKRDVVGELKAATESRGLKFGVSSHLAHNWTFFPKSREFDTLDPKYEKLYAPAHDGWVPRKFLDFWLARTKELIDKTQPDKLWFDFGWERPEFEPLRREVVAYYYNRAEEWGKEVVLTYKVDHLEAGTAVLDLERGRLDDVRPMVWQTDTSIGWHDWSYKVDEEYKPTDMIVCELIDIVSKNGVLLLNIGPRPDGTIPEEQVSVLEALGKWLGLNGEAIYDTRPWSTCGEGPTVFESGHMNEGKNRGKSYTGEDIRFTTTKDAFYAIFMDWPGPGRKIIKSLVGNSFMTRQVTGVELLGHGPVEWDVDHEGFHVGMPKKRPCEYACSVKISLDRGG